MLLTAQHQDFSIPDLRGSWTDPLHHSSIWCSAHHQKVSKSLRSSLILCVILCVCVCVRAHARGSQKSGVILLYLSTLISAKFSK